MDGLSPLHILLVVLVPLLAITLDAYVFVRLVRLREGLSGRVVFWGLLTLLVPLIGALAVLFALPRADPATQSTTH